MSQILGHPRWRTMPLAFCAGRQPARKWEKAESSNLTQRDKPFSIRPGVEGYKYSDIAKLQTAAPPGPYTLKPKAFVLAWTVEKITIPYTSRLAARVEGKSSLARLGVAVHATAPVIHSGFEGPIQLELCNFGPNEIILDPGMYVCQLGPVLS